MVANGSQNRPGNDGMNRTRQQKRHREEQDRPNSPTSCHRPSLQALASLASYVIAEIYTPTTG
jgi:hypothetical protein